MNNKDKAVETSLLTKTKALRDELKDEVEQIKYRLETIENDLNGITSEKNDLVAKKRQLEPWLTRTEADLAKLEPEDKPVPTVEEVVKLPEKKPMPQKSKILAVKSDDRKKDDKNKTEVKNDQ